MKLFCCFQVASGQKKICSEKQVDSREGPASSSEKATTVNLLKRGAACSKDVNIHRVGDTVMLDITKDDSADSGCDADLVDTSGKDADKVCF